MSFSGYCRASAIAIVILLASAMGWTQAASPGNNNPSNMKAAPTAAEAQAFIEQAERRLLDLGSKGQRASWVQENFITEDTEGIAADSQSEYTAAVSELAEKANRYKDLKLSADTSRKIELLRLSLSAPAPNNPTERDELTKIAVSMDSDYGKGKVCLPASGGAASPGAPAGAADAARCMGITEVERIMQTERDPQKLLELWQGWHAVAPPMRQRYARFVQLSNKGAREMGFKDVGAMWRSNYDMPPDQFSAELERVWTQLRPLYLQLHAYVRKRLVEKYGPAVVPPQGMIPAHLLGNMWAQDWSNIYPLVAPPASNTGYDLTQILQARKTTELDMVHYGEHFFTSLGFAPLPKTFWERSLFKKPADRDVVCHASAWDVDNVEDLRIKMCIKIDAEDFTTIHHELGHNFYQRAYNRQPGFYRDSANDGFHEAIGDTIALSVSPDYLKDLGFINKVPGPDGDIALLLKKALEKVAFLPFGLMIDEWRWRVFSGEVTPADYNKSWWELRNSYQGVSAPVPRSEADFDPAAKYHVAANVPYARYFLAALYQFQFHRALCRIAGYKGPLHRCSIYGNKAAGARLNAMLEMGKSKPWPDELEVLTGQRDIDPSAMLEYFAPLMKWLEEQNKGEKIGW